MEWWINSVVSSERFVAETKFIKLPQYDDADLVMCYVSTKEEADTWWLLQKVIQDGKKLVVPRIDGDMMEFYILEDLNKLQSGKFGIFEPSHDCELYIPKKGDLMAVPGVGFDEKCNRKGHGRGYYDKYFGKYGSGTFCKIAFALEFQVEKQLANVMPHDVPMDMILTEERIISRV